MGDEEGWKHPHIQSYYNFEINQNKIEFKLKYFCFGGCMFEEWNTFAVWYLIEFLGYNL